LRLAFRISSLTKDSDGRNGETATRQNGAKTDPVFPRFGHLPKCAGG